MIVTAALIWWDEPAEVLERCIRGIATVANRVVAVDGAYRRYPGATVTSPSEQAAVIRSTAKELKLECDIYFPKELWDGQIAKRTFALQRAAEGSDWIAQVDADWVISADAEAVRKELQDVQHHVVNVDFCTPRAAVAFSTNWHRRTSGKCHRYPHFYRALPGIRVERRHWWISAMLRGKRVWLYHPQKVHTERPTLSQWALKAPYRINHMFSQHTRTQMLASRAFCNDRNMVVKLTGQEDHVEGLPDPVFDYATIPY